MVGGEGNDSLRNDTYEGEAKKVTINGGKGDDYISNNGSQVSIDGGTGNDSLSGGSGKDTLSGGDGDDKLLGGTGNDSLSGGSGKDTLSGSTGDDKLLGGAGNDSLSGGDGADTFIYEAGDGKDIIYSFANNDTLTIDNLTYTSSYNTSTGLIKFTVANGSITFKDFTATTFHINNDTYKITNGKFKAC
ncbi:MAG: hypothetical protein IJG33_16185 [Selenomonadaceae bacterium]|nr:hypothetical protein [Selenomonadaceae bacterium]